MKKALIAASNHWNSPSQVGTHSIARALIRSGWRVLFVSEPITPFHFLKKNDFLVRQRFDIYRKGGLSDFDGKLFAYVPFAFAAPQAYPVLRSNYVHKNWQNLTVPNLIGFVKGKGFGKVDLLYFDNSIQSFWLNEIEYEKSVFRFADNYSGYRKFTNKTAELERFLVENVDSVLYTAVNLAEYLKKYNIKDLRYFPNGVDFGHFNNPNIEEPAEYKELKKPIIVYAGEMEVRFDFELLRYAAKELPDFSFVLIGNDSTVRKKLDGIFNVHILGAKPYEILPRYFRYADVGIIPFDTEKHPELIKYVNPLKMYQYFSAGLPVVCREWDVVRDLDSPAYLYNSREEFVEYLKKAVHSETGENKLYDFARLLDWDEKIKLLVESLDLTHD